jgi:hypothetical protein
MEDMIRKYVQQYGIQPLKLQRDHKIALLKHDYDAEIIERKFLQENPNEYQVNQFIRPKRMNRSILSLHYLDTNC